jgi:hypothetical protein
VIRSEVKEWVGGREGKGRPRKPCVKAMERGALNKQMHKPKKKVYLVLDNMVYML